MTEEPRVWGNIPGALLVCLDSETSGVLCGRLYSQYRKHPQRFKSLDEMLQIADEWMDEWEFPQAAYERRTFLSLPKDVERLEFTEKRKRIKMQYDWNEIFTNRSRGAVGTLWFQVIYRQNASWQGRAVWIRHRGKNPEIVFRSALELLRAIREIAVIPQTEVEEAFQA